LSTVYYERGISSSLRRLAKHFPAVVVTGARQSGKTTLLQTTFPAYRYVSLDLPSEAERADKDPNALLSDNPPPLIVDEIQYAPDLFRHLKVRIDQRRSDYGQFILSGSQKFPLMREVTESLAGRVGLLELETLAAADICANTDLPAKHREHARLLCRGGFPELWKQPDLPRDDFFRSYVATYIERDVRQLLNVSSLRDFERFVRLCAARNAQLLNKTELARGVGVTLKTISQWISVLQTSNQIYLLEPYMGNLGKRIVKSPKLYFRDTGLLCFLLGVDETSLSTSPFRGEIWETYVLSELRKHLALCEPSAALWFYRDREGREVDFIVTKGHELTLIESKWTTRVDASDAKWMRDVAQYVATKGDSSLVVAKMYLACRTEHPYPLEGGGRLHAINGIRIAEQIWR
jgi:predicted AAA+ superfamily ATPase